MKVTKIELLLDEAKNKLDYLLEKEDSILPVDLQIIRNNIEKASFELSSIEENKKEEQEDFFVSNTIKKVNDLSACIAYPLLPNNQFFEKILEASLSLLSEDACGGLLLVKTGTGYKSPASKNCIIDLAKGEVFFNYLQKSSSVQFFSKGNSEAFPSEDIFLCFDQVFDDNHSYLFRAFTQFEEPMILVLKLNDSENKPNKEIINFFEAIGLLITTYLKTQKDTSDLENINKELIVSNSRIEASYEEIEKLSEKLRSMLNITSNLGSQTQGLEEYYTRLMKTSLMLIEEADYAIISLVKGKSCRFITSIGHSITKLKKLKIPAISCPYSEDVTIYNSNLAHRLNGTAEGQRPLLEKLLLPVKSSMVISLPLDESSRLDICIEIAEGNPSSFKQNSKKIFKSFAELAGSFLKTKIFQEKIQNSYIQFANKLAIVSESYDSQTSAHNYRVGELSWFIARSFRLSPDLVDDIRKYAPLHDIGKIFIDRELLNKKETLNQEEWDQLKMHTLLAGNLLDKDFFGVARNIAMYHHEKYDGSGYPCGFSGSDIPIEAQIVAIADVYDALRSTRAYKTALCHNEAIKMMLAKQGRIKVSDFNPKLLRLFTDYSQEIDNYYLSVMKRAPKNVPEDAFSRAVTAFNQVW